ncbi:hypothetical protein [Chryseobacterium sp. CBTAP 102]|uniref:hypothetical protein n=1 Tax=Chryseobacterium sp. CBTAP 102 TaxID=2135644 RepID=UPI001E65C27D|nr:hypothetical protein [Chryseobacterium sp. CBTAP 102]
MCLLTIGSPLYDHGEISKVVCVVSYSLKRKEGNIRIISNTSETYLKYNLFTGKWTEESKVALKLWEIGIVRLFLQGTKNRRNCRTVIRVARYHKILQEQIV